MAISYLVQLWVVNRYLTLFSLVFAMVASCLSGAGSMATLSAVRLLARAEHWLVCWKPLPAGSTPPLQLNFSPLPFPERYTLTAKSAEHIAEKHITIKIHDVYTMSFPRTPALIWNISIPGLAIVLIGTLWFCHVHLTYTMDWYLFNVYFIKL